MWNQPSTEQLAAIPRLNSQPDTPLNDMIIYLYFFVGGCDWYIAEYDGNDTFFGFACLGDVEMAEWGSISFQELKELEIPSDVIDETTKTDMWMMNDEVECERNWKPRKFAEIAQEKGYPL